MPTETTTPPMRRTGVFTNTKTAEKLFTNTQVPDMQQRHMKTTADREMGLTLASILADGRPYLVQMQRIDNFTETDDEAILDTRRKIESEIFRERVERTGANSFWEHSWWFYELRATVLLMDPEQAEVGDALPPNALDNVEWDTYGGCHLRRSLWMRSGTKYFRSMLAPTDGETYWVCTEE